MSTDYQWRTDHGEDVCCDSCHTPAPTAGFDWGPPFNVKHPTPQRMLCEFCSTTMASRYTEYPAMDGYSQMRAAVFEAAGALFNMLTHKKG